MKWPGLDVKDEFGFLKEDQYIDVNYNILPGTEIYMNIKKRPCFEDILYFNEAAHQAINKKQDAAINRKKVNQNKLAKYDAQIETNRKLQFTSINSLYFNQTHVRLIESMKSIKPAGVVVDCGSGRGGCGG